MGEQQSSAAAELWAMAHLGTPMAIRVAATLRIADHIAAGIQTAPDLAGTVHADPDALERLLRYLARRAVLTVDRHGRYGLTPLGEPLRSDHPSDLRRGLDIESVGRADLAFVQLLHSVRTGEAGFPLQFGRSFWEDLQTDPERHEIFTNWMGSDIPARSPDIAAGHDWESLGSVVDVGGGDGSLLIALLTKYAGLSGTVVDLPETAATARAALAAAGLADRSDVVAGSFFDPLPVGAGGYLLSLILHDWPDDPARAILRRCAEAAGRTGRVFVIERTGADGRATHSGMDLRMLVLYGGKERGVEELTALAVDAGLRLVAVHPAGGFSIVELTAA
ncbi:MAG TPA: methyltransferase [Pseudonocardiaceae bacterium]